MYIDNLLIERAEMDFRFCDTVNQMELRVQDMKAYLYKINFDKAFVSNQYPLFFLVAESGANEIIKNDIDNRLVKELEDELAKIKLTKAA